MLTRTEERQNRKATESLRIARILRANPEIGVLCRNGKRVYYSYLNGVCYREHKDPAALVAAAQ